MDGDGFCCTDQGKTRSLNPGQNDNYERAQFYYHPDHLGSSSFITNLDGDVAQHIEYVPFGEVFIEERNNVWNTPYLFNAKELDEETGLYYYGARYYDPRISLWLSADPLQEKYPNLTSYCYTANNPIKFIDPDGQTPRIYTERQGVGHAFITVGEGKNTIVYTYGRYLGGDKGKSSGNSLDPTGRGVLIKLSGKEAQRYIKHELKNMNAKAYEITDANDAKAQEYLDKLFSAGRNLNTDESNSYNNNPNKFGSADDARVIDTYDLLNNNCTTKAIDGAKAGGTKEKFLEETGVLAPDVPSRQYQPLSPAGVDDHLRTRANTKGSNVKDVTRQMNKELGN